MTIRLLALFVLGLSVSAWLKPRAEALRERTTSSQPR